MSQEKNIFPVENVGSGGELEKWGTSRPVMKPDFSQNPCWDFERNDSINNVGPQARVDFGGANQPKGLGAHFYECMQKCAPKRA